MLLFVNSSKKFRYIHEKTLFRHFHVCSYCCIIGESGSGKSTIGSLLLRFYDVNGGCISVGGENIQNIDPSILREYIGTVSQVIPKTASSCCFH